MKVNDFTQSPAVQALVASAGQKLKNRNYSNITDLQDNQYVDVVFGGGGILGIALVGYVYLLEQVGIRFLSISGTSAGAIVATILAALDSKEKPKAELLLEELADVNFRSFVDGDFAVRILVDDVVPHASKAELVVAGATVYLKDHNKSGLNPGNAFLNWISGVLAKRGVHTVKDLQARVKELPAGIQNTGEEPWPGLPDWPLKIVTADIATQTKVVLPEMGELFWDNPDQLDPATLVRASMSIPIFFEPVTVPLPAATPRRLQLWDSLAGYKEDLPSHSVFVDGGVMSNFPINIFHRNDRTPSAPTFGATFKSKRRNDNLHTMADLPFPVFDSARHCLDYDFITNNRDYQQLVCAIDTKDVNWLNFKLSDGDKIKLFTYGVEAAHTFLSSFDWEGYKRLRGELAGVNTRVPSTPSPAGP